MRVWEPPNPFQTRMARLYAVSNHSAFCTTLVQ